MDRIIKFRAKLLKRDGDKAKGEWVYGLPQQRAEIGGVPNPNKPPEIGYIVTWEPERGLQSGAPDNDLYWYEIDPQTLGEWTGYLDRRGQDIYEDDIVIADWCWTEPHKIILPHDQYDFIEFGLDSANINIIGNIHDKKPEQGA